MALPVAQVSALYFDWLTSNAFPPLVSRQTVSEKAASSSQSEG
jgi:hypothetical protein